MPLPECMRIDIDNFDEGAHLSVVGWREIETLETYHGNLRNVIGPVADNEVADLARIAMSSYTQDRLHADSQVDRTLADAAKAKWVVDACADHHRDVYVYRVSGQPVAFISIAFEKDRGYRVDLLAVEKTHRGQGIAKALLLYACGAKNIGALWAGTQSTNEAAKALYESLGMSLVKRERTFHRP